MTKKICRFCKFLELQEGIDPKNLSSYFSSYPCKKLEEVLDIEMSTHGWDGYSSIDAICPPNPDWSCGSWERRENETK